MNFQEILKQAERGIHQAPTLTGYRHPYIKGWKELATTNPDKIREMAANGYSGCNWVSVAKDGFACIIDIDDVEYAKSIGMPIPWDTFIVNTPSGGLHLYLWHTEESAKLGNTNILGPDGSPAVEFKANNLTCASPGVLRSDKEPHGYYAPANDNEIQPISKELVEFVRTHGKQKKQYTARASKREFHPSYELEDEIEHQDWSMTGEEKVGSDGVRYIEFAVCPIDEEVHAGMERPCNFKCCLTIGDYGIGFDCKAGRHDHLTISDVWEACEARGIESYPYCRYLDEDKTLEATTLVETFGVENAALREELGVKSADTLPESLHVSSKASFPESVSTADTTSDPMRYSDAGNAMRLAQIYGKDILYCRQSDEYYVWGSTRWVRDLNNVRVLRMAKAVTEEMFREAESLGEDAAKALRSHALKSQSVARLSGMVNLAKIHVRNIDRGDFDSDPWLFNCVTGTIDLKTGACREHRREDLISKLAPVKYDPTADCSLWKKCLSDWMLGDEEKVGYLQRQAGYTLTGCTNEEVMPILWGAGRNGKSKFYVTIYNVLGDGEYAKAANFDSFVVKKGDEGMPNDVAGWCGMRLIVAAEGEHSKRLAEAKLKLCIGRDPVTGEFKYQEEFNYIPTYKVWLVTNPKPRIVGTTEAIWDKIHFVAWKRYFRPEERDTELQEKLDVEASGILNWMIEGCLQWQKIGLALPASMREDTETYRHEQDVVGRFIDEEGVLGEQFISPKKRTYECFKEWADDAGEHYTMTQVEFNEKMLAKFEEGRSKDGRFWRGFKVKRFESEFESDLAARGTTTDDVLNSFQ